MTRFGALLAEGLARRELIVGAVLLSTFTIVVALNSAEAGWKFGYCIAGALGIVGTFVVMRSNWRLQWLGSVGIILANVVLLIVHGRISG
ncbi:hypothetical protein [Nocardia shimofusensis]|uniref:hypothetical protein n=1 Tax=Nocardia shimofusensis TaxID=228596 RepID=UPI0012EE3BA2|nr:hypothetical protein [Nocardia shimofusensis]